MTKQDKAQAKRDRRAERGPGFAATQPAHDRDRWWKRRNAWSQWVRDRNEARAATVSKRSAEARQQAQARATARVAQLVRQETTEQQRRARRQSRAG